MAPEERFRLALQRLSDGAQVNVARHAAKIDFTKTFAEVQDQLVEVYSAVTLVHGEAATAQAADLYDHLRSAANVDGHYTAKMLDLLPEQAWGEGQKIVGRAMNRLDVEAPAATINAVAKAAGNRVRNSAHETITTNANADKAKPRYSVKLHCDLAACHKKNRPEWQCDVVAAEVEALDHGEAPDHWFHPSCGCVVTPNWTKGPKLRGGTSDKEVQWVPDDEPETSNAGGGAKLPPRRGMLGPVGDDEFPKFNGYQPPARRSEIQEFTEDDAYALLFGDGSGHGHHAHGEGIKDSEFPPGWREKEVMEWVRNIVDNPTSAEPAGRKLDKEFDLFGTDGRVSGRVCVRHDRTYYISTAYPDPPNRR